MGAVKVVAAWPFPVPAVDLHRHSADFKSGDRHPLVPAGVRRRKRELLSDLLVDQRIWSVNAPISPCAPAGGGRALLRVSCDSVVTLTPPIRVSDAREARPGRPARRDSSPANSGFGRGSLRQGWSRSR